MRRYRIYTEDLNRDHITKYLRQNKVTEFTIYSVTGYWQGAVEKSMIIEIISNTVTLQDISLFSEYIKKINKQNAVLITWDNTTERIV